MAPHSLIRSHTLVLEHMGLKILLCGLYDAVATCKQAMLILGIYIRDRL